MGGSPWSLEESDTTERLDFHFSLSCIGQGNGNPLRCSCLENPRDGGAWWAAVSRVAQSRTRLKWLSSSSSSDHIKRRGAFGGWWGHESWGWSSYKWDQCRYKSDSKELPPLSAMWGLSEKAAFFELGRGPSPKTEFVRALILDFSVSRTIRSLKKNNFFLAALYSMWSLVPLPGIKPISPAVEAQSLNHWTTREVPTVCFLSH